jgi:hypothetical protein
MLPERMPGIPPEAQNVTADELTHSDEVTQ